MPDTMEGAERPLCRSCGKPIAKRTTMHQLLMSRSSQTRHDTEFWKTITVDQLPATREQCKAYTNQPIVSIRRYRGEQIWAFTTWDGRSYVDLYFCTGRCAQAFGYLMAQAGYSTKAYTAAERGRK